MRRSVTVSALGALLLLSTSAWAQDPASAPAASDTPAPASAAPASDSPASASPASEAPAPAGEAPASPEGAGIDTPPTGKGRVVFFRPSFVGVAIGCAVHENGETLSRLPYGKYFIQDFDPGIHTFMTESESKQTLRMEIEAGETYYVKCTIGMGIILGRPNLSPSDKATFDKASKRLRLEPPPAAKAA